jgi:hypothetical protein
MMSNRVDQNGLLGQLSVSQTRTSAECWHGVTDEVHLRLHSELSRWQLHDMLRDQIYVSLHAQLREQT